MLLAVVARRARKEQRRLRLTEAVDALLHVAHQEQPVLARKAAHDRLLNGAGILVLVDEHIAVLRVKRLAHLVVRKRLQRAMLQIIKVHQRAPALGRRVERVVGAHQLAKAAQRRLRHRKIGRRILEAHAKQLSQRRHRLLHALAPLLHLPGDLLVKDVGLLLSAQRGIGDGRKRRPQRRIALRRCAKQLLQERRVLRAGRGIVRGAALSPAERERLARIGKQLLQLLRRVGHQ